MVLVLFGFRLFANSASSDSSLRGVGRQEIESVHSHIHALGQCRKYIRRNRWKPMVAGDTAGAARLVRDLGDRTMAALAPRLAADLYGLDILEENVEDSDTTIDPGTAVNESTTGSVVEVVRSCRIVHATSTASAAKLVSRSTAK